MQNVTAERFRPFGTTIFAEMTRLAMEHGAINLSQGFPDFEGPPEIVDHVVEALRSGHNQYARSMGMPGLVEALARLRSRHFGIEYDPMTEIVVTSGATECIAAALLGLVNPGDEVILFEPFYDSYPAAVAMAGGVPKFYTLEFPEFSIDREKLRRVFSSRTKVVILNTPHNPSGKVFTKAELQIIADLAIEHDAIVISDEVYEFLTYDGAVHIPIASLDGMRERTLSISSAGKSFSFTGWKIGWGFGPRSIVSAVQSAHQFVTFATSTPVQVGLGNALASLDAGYFETLAAEYDQRRKFLVGVLEDAGLIVSVPKGTYFVLADFSNEFGGTDVELARHLIEARGVAAIPPSFFYKARPQAGQKLIRFAFCKKMETLQAAAERLRSL